MRLLPRTLHQVFRAMISPVEEFMHRHLQRHGSLFYVDALCDVRLDLDLEQCFQMLKEFSGRYPGVWAEDIGEL